MFKQADCTILHKNDDQIENSVETQTTGMFEVCGMSVSWYHHRDLVAHTYFFSTLRDLFERALSKLALGTEQKVNPC